MWYVTWASSVSAFLAEQSEKASELRVVVDFSTSRIVQRDFHSHNRSSSPSFPPIQFLHITDACSIYFLNFLIRFIF